MAIALIGAIATRSIPAPDACRAFRWRCLFAKATPVRQTVHSAGRIARQRGNEKLLLPAEFHLLTHRCPCNSSFAGRFLRNTGRCGFLRGPKVYVSQRIEQSSRCGRQQGGNMSGRSQEQGRSSGSAGMTRVRLQGVNHSKPKSFSLWAAI